MFIALHTNKLISSILWKVWEHTSIGYCEGVLATGTMCKLPNDDEFTSWEDVDIFKEESTDFSNY